MLQPAKKRSKTCILVKNLPANTDKDEIKVLFEKHGRIARFLMPKHGITALVDFIEPFEAKKAFTKLAYTQFKSTPLYLEWAPEDVFVKYVDKASSNSEVADQETDSNNADKVKEEIEKNEESTENIEEFIQDNEKPENDTTLFVKNLNFKTNEDSLKSVRNIINI